MIDVLLVGVLNLTATTVAHNKLTDRSDCVVCAGSSPGIIRKRFEGSLFPYVEQSSGDGRSSGVNAGEIGATSSPACILLAIFHYPLDHLATVNKWFINSG